MGRLSVPYFSDSKDGRIVVSPPVFAPGLGDSKVGAGNGMTGELGFVAKAAFPLLLIDELNYLAYRVDGMLHRVPSRARTGSRPCDLPTIPSRAWGVKPARR